MFRVHGAVGISGSDKKGTNRLTRGPCPGQPFMTASALSSTLDVDYNGSRATWNCAEPEYEFGELPFTPGPKTFTFDPPGPYKCEWYAVYGTRDSESFTVNPDGTCSVTVDWPRRWRSRGSRGQRGWMGPGCSAGRSCWMASPALGVQAAGGCWHP